MSGWRIAIACAVPVGGALLFLKLVADSLASTAAHLESLERVEEQAWHQRRHRAEQEARKDQESQQDETTIGSAQVAQVGLDRRS